MLKNVEALNRTTAFQYEGNYDALVAYFGPWDPNGNKSYGVLKGTDGVVYFKNRSQAPGYQQVVEVGSWIVEGNVYTEESFFYNFRTIDPW